MSIGDGVNKFWSKLQRTDLLAYLSGMVAAITVTVAVSTFMDGYLASGDPRVSMRQSELTKLRSEIKSNKNELNSVSTIIEDYQAELSSLIAKSEDAEIAALQIQVKRQSEELQRMRTALGGDVEKSLSVALLRKDLERLESSHEELVDSTARSVDRIYDQNKWFLGLMATMTLSVIGLALSVFGSRKKDAEQS